MLDTKGIHLTEINRRYPRQAQLLGYDALLGVDALGKPKVIPTFEMAVNVIITLLLMKPGQYPSIPDLGIDIESYLFEYADDEFIPANIKAKLNEQCNRLQVSGVDINIHMDTLPDGTNVMLVEIVANELMYMNGTNGAEPNRVIVGISYDKLNRVYIRKKYIERSAST